MARSNKHQWRERTRPQVQPQQVAGAVPLDQIQAQRDHQEALIRARVENLAAAIYAQNISGAVDDDGQFSRQIASSVCQFSIDAALLFAGEVWGIQGQRVSNQQKVAPQPLQVAGGDDDEPYDGPYNEQPAATEPQAVIEGSAEDHF